MAVAHSLYPENGKPYIDERTCTQCGVCAGICAAEVLIMKAGRVRVQEDSPFGCIACGHCMMSCSTNSITVTGRGISPKDLLPMPQAEERASARSLNALMLARRSVRRFTQEEVTHEDLGKIVEMASSAPMGIPPWDIGCVIVQGRDKVHELATQIIKDYEGFLKIFGPWVLTLMRPFMRKETIQQYRDFIFPLAKSYVASWHEGRDVLFYNAPAVILFHHSPYAEAVDASIACTYAMLAAESLGLGNTMIGGAPPIIQRNKMLSKSLGIPPPNKVAMALIVGHPAVSFCRAIRRHFTTVKNVK